MPKKYYTKDEDGNFVEAGWEFTGFPADGVWLVKDGKQNLVERVQDVNPYPEDIKYDYLAYAEDLATHLRERTKDQGEGISMYDLSKVACEFFSEVGKKSVENRAKELFEF